MTLKLVVPPTVAKLVLVMLAKDPGEWLISVTTISEGCQCADICQEAKSEIFHVSQCEDKDGLFKYSA